MHVDMWTYGSNGNYRLNEQSGRYGKGSQSVRLSGVKSIPTTKKIKREKFYIFQKHFSLFFNVGRQGLLKLQV